MDALEAKHADMMRKRTARHAEEERGKDKGLPVKLASGQIARNARSLQPEVQESSVKNRVAHAADDEEEEESETEAQKKRKAKAAQPKANPFGARFGRPAVTSVLEIEDRMERLVAAREELATLGREIIAEPELGMNLLKRLLSFTNEVFCPPGVKKEDGLPVDLPVRSLAMLSALAVFLDITP
jgi:nucleolar complex protein 3